MRVRPALVLLVACGAIVGALRDEPSALPGGGAAVNVATPWGDVTYYAAESIAEVPDDEHFEWKWIGG